MLPSVIEQAGCLDRSLGELDASISHWVGWMIRSVIAYDQGELRALFPDLWHQVSCIGADRKARKT